MDMHPVSDIVDAVNLSHPGLGGLAAMTMIAAKAKLCMLVVSPPGCGKSAITNWAGEVHPDAYIKHSVTRSSLKVYEEQFNHFRGLLLFDDIGAIDTEWSRIQTLVTMAEMVYGHFVSKDSHQLHIEIEDFQGAAILNVQPNILKEVIAHPTWHANLADKSMRLYHLIRATEPNGKAIDHPVDWGLELDEVEAYEGDSPIWKKILEIGMEQWTYPRALEHCQRMIKAVAALGRAPIPSHEELSILLDLMRPMTVEMELIVKSGFGSKADFHDNLLYMLVEFATYKILTYDQIAMDYKMKPTQVASILSNMVEWFEKIGTNPIKLQGTDQLTNLLKKAGIR